MPFSFADRAASEAALAGVEVLLMVSASESADRLDQHRTFVDAAAAAGVRHIVYTSFVGAAPDAIFTLVRDHYATEQHIKQPGWRTRSCGTTSISTSWRPVRGRRHHPRPGGRRPGGHGGAPRRGPGRRRRAARPRPHAGVTYDPDRTGGADPGRGRRSSRPRAGRPISFHNETLEEAYASRASYGAPDWQVEAWVSTYTAIAAGELDVVTDDIERITGEPPISLADHSWLRSVQMAHVADNLEAVRDRIAEACRRVGRDPDSVRLLPVSKTHGPALIEEAYAAGARLFGENRVQEAKEKAEHFADRATSSGP